MEENNDTLTNALVELMKLLQKAKDEQSHMTEQEKQNNAIKMGDIFY